MNVSAKDSLRHCIAQSVSQDSIYDERLALSGGSIQLDIENTIEYSIEFSIEFCSTVEHLVKLNRNLNRVFNIQLNWASVYPASDSRCPGEGPPISGI